MSVKQYIDELSKINVEIKLNNQKNKNLRKRASELENSISEYLKSKKQEGLKYNGQAIIMQHKDKYSIKPKKDKKTDTILLLQSLGVDNPDGAYTQLMNVQKGDVVPTEKIAFKNLKIL